MVKNATKVPIFMPSVQILAIGISLCSEWLWDADCRPQFFDFLTQRRFIESCAFLVCSIIYSRRFFHVRPFRVERNLNFSMLSRRACTLCSGRRARLQIFPRPQNSFRSYLVVLAFLCFLNAAFTGRMNGKFSREQSWDHGPHFHGIFWRKKFFFSLK